MKKFFTTAALGLIIISAFTACEKDELTNEEIQIAKKWIIYKWSNKYVGDVEVNNGSYIELKNDRSYTNSVSNLGASSGTWMILNGKLSLSSTGNNKSYYITSVAPELVLFDNNNDGIQDSTTFYFQP